MVIGSIVTWETLPNTADWDSFRSPILQEVLKNSKCTAVGILSIFGSRTFVPINWMCQKLTADSHSSTVSEVISFDARFRMDGVPALNLWDLIIVVIHSPSLSSLSLERPGAVRLQCETHPKIRTELKLSTSEESCLREIDHVAPNAKLSHHGALLYISEVNEAVIKMIIKGKSRTMRHVSRTQRMALDWLLDGINLDPTIQGKYVDTRSQLADILTKGTFTRDEWNHLLQLF